MSGGSWVPGQHRVHLRFYYEERGNVRETIQHGQNRRQRQTEIRVKMLQTKELTTTRSLKKQKTVSVLESPEGKQFCWPLWTSGSRVVREQCCFKPRSLRSFVTTAVETDTGFEVISRMISKFTLHKDEQRDHYPHGGFHVLCDTKAWTLSWSISSSAAALGS